ncbi:MAG: hypothetical protein A2Y25_09045 [Candidatus Melainabacteria bacterium GWF2_37_15]|nr:MAG: hypothetical protein A2Y25_09045 [Candidatus Melainabacteria bacterium GWF2_37_15]
MGYVLVLGANSHIAKALAEKYASYGYDLYLVDKDPENLEETRNRIAEQHGVDVQLLKLDITEFYNHRNFYNSLSPKPFGVISTVDYQGDEIRAHKDFLETKKIIDINYTGLVAMLNIIATDFEECGSGFIIAVSYASNKKEELAHYTYKSAKDGLTSYISGLRNRLDKAGVNVLTVMQGLDVADPEKFAEEILAAQQKDKDIIYSKEAGNLAGLVKGLGWK